MDEIFFGSSNMNLCNEFEKVMKSKFEMTVMGELNFFLGLQVNQKKKDGFFIHQTRYVHDLFACFKMEVSKSIETRLNKTTNWVWLSQMMKMSI